MEDFILHNQGGKEPGVIIVQDQETLMSVIDFLVGSSFSNPQTLSDFTLDIDKGGRIALSQDEIVSDTSSYFDVMHGFASGSVDIHDTHVSPRYKETNLVLVLSSTFIESELESGRDWRSLCGLSLQYKYE